ncbi:hypothetical protein MNEG_4149 [Monoraphidium neglectum]|uniref:Uncharacterized protein n=1 Tax=Monoraphidium neglectum TaxID=145388 RepID=A0A0D2LAI9_9CHLO|nr:hypothetical protein MNEG_4149 [Monoraphidium neglectum]KIZ03809.1 hypothetical protein MNEG_4149 [Monoraphidium neglectum]|eukprot:XP_013902828.1 hypothetical protein MNEG_4149 [Monoraphidium neglectum]
MTTLVAPDTATLEQQMASTPPEQRCAVFLRVERANAAQRRAMVGWRTRAGQLLRSSSEESRIKGLAQLQVASYEGRGALQRTMEMTQLAMDAALTLHKSAADAVLLESSRIAQGQEGAGEWLRRMVREQTGAVLRLLDPGPDCLGPLAAPALEARYGITLTQLEVVARFLFITHAKGAEPDGLVAALREARVCTDRLMVAEGNSIFAKYMMADIIEWTDGWSPELVARLREVAELSAVKVPPAAAAPSPSFPSSTSSSAPNEQQQQEQEQQQEQQQQQLPAEGTSVDDVYGCIACWNLLRVMVGGPRPYRVGDYRRFKAQAAAHKAALKKWGYYDVAARRRVDAIASGVQELFKDALSRALAAQTGRRPQDISSEELRAAPDDLEIQALPEDTYQEGVGVGAQQLGDALVPPVQTCDHCQLPFGKLNLCTGCR